MSARGHELPALSAAGSVRSDTVKRPRRARTAVTWLRREYSGRVRRRELLTRSLRNFGRTQHYTEEEVDAKMSRRFMSINLAKPIETVEQFPFELCA